MGISSELIPVRLYSTLTGTSGYCFQPLQLQPGAGVPAVQFQDPLQGFPAFPGPAKHTEEPGHAEADPGFAQGVLCQGRGAFIIVQGRGGGTPAFHDQAKVRRDLPDRGVWRPFRKQGFSLRLTPPQDELESVVEGEVRAFDAVYPGLAEQSAVSENRRWRSKYQAPQR